MNRSHKKTIKHGFLNLKKAQNKKQINPEYTIYSTIISLYKYNLHRFIYINTKDFPKERYNT